MPDAPANLLFEFVLEKAGDELPARRASLYRALAKVVGNEREAVALNTLATDCEAIDAAHAQLVFDFRKRAQAQRKPEAQN